MPRLAGLCLLAALSGFTAANAAITTFTLSKSSFSSQISDAQPPDEYYAVFASIFTDTPFDLLDGVLTAPDGFTQWPMYFSPDQYLAHATVGYPTFAAMEADYPSGTYNFAVTAGPAAPANADLFVGPSDFPDSVPYLTGGSWSALQNAPSNTDATVTFDPITHSGTAANQSTSILIVDYTLAGTVFTDSGPGSMSSSTIPAAAMKSGHYYGGNLNYFSYDEFVNAGFDNATGYTTWDRYTGFLFHVKADPGTIAGRITFEDFYPDPAGQPVQVEVLDTDGTVLDAQTITAGNFGYYAFDTTVTGVRRVRFKGAHWLSSVVASANIDAGEDVLDVSLRNGDIDGNNVIDSDDFDILVANFGTPGPDGNLNGYVDVDSDDFDILVKNFGFNGD